MKTKRQKKQGGEAITRILGLGSVDLTFKLKLLKEDLSKAEVDFESIAKITDLKFLAQRQDLWKAIKVSTDNNTLNTLLFLNKATKRKAYIDYIPFAYPAFSEEEKFIGDIVKSVTESNNFLCINESPLAEGRYCLVFQIVCEDKEKVFTLGTSKQDEEKKRQEEEKKSKEEGKPIEAQGTPIEDCKAKDMPIDAKAKEGQSPQIEESKEFEANKVKNIKTMDTLSSQAGYRPEIQNKDSPFNKMIMHCSSYDIFYVDITDIITFKAPSFEYDDFVDFLVYLKTRAYPPTIAISYSGFDQKTHDMILLNRVLILSDVYYFNLKEASSSFDSHYNYFTQDSQMKIIDERKTFDYFISGIARGGGTTVYGNKIGIFLEDFIRMTIVETTKKHADKIVYDCQPYPKVNHVNLKLVEAYREVIKRKYDFLRAIFFGGFLSKLAGLGSKRGQEIIYPAFLVGLEIVKRAVELFKNNFLISDEEEFFYVKLSQAKIEQDLKSYYLENKEGGFVLDCVNKEKSSMKDYMPLYDYHLNSFFSSDIIRKDLKNKGFINTQGFIMYDPVYRRVMGASCKNELNEQNEKEMNERLLLAIQGISVARDYKAKEVDTHNKVLRSKSPTSNRIPLPSISSEYCSSKGDVGKSKGGNKSRSKSRSPKRTEGYNTNETNQNNKTEMKNELKTADDKKAEPLK